MKTRRLTSKRYNEFKYTHISERIENLLKCIVGVVLFFLVCLMGASCSTPEIETQHTQIHVSHDPVPQHITGTYQSESKELITITPDTITIGSESYFLPAYRTIDNKGCWYSLYLENGSEMRLKYFRLKHGYITFKDIKYYTDGNNKNYITN